MDEQALTVRTANAEDFEALVQCDEYAKAHASRREALRGWVNEGSCLLAEIRNQPVGFAVLQHSFFGNGFIVLICVASAWWRQGVGLQLLSHVEACCRTRKLFTSTNASNGQARRLFERAGFVPSGQIENLDEGDAELVFFKLVDEQALRLEVNQDKLD